MLPLRPSNIWRLLIVVEPGTGYDVPAQIDAKRVSILILDPGT